jgi:hypothetical protein
VTKRNKFGERLRAVRRGVRTGAIACGTAVALALALAATTPASGEVQHGVFVFDCYETGFSPAEITTDKGRSTLFIHNGSGVNQAYTVTRKRPGKKKKVIFQGSTVPGQSIAGDTKFASGDVFIIRETNTGNEARIVVR